MIAVLQETQGERVHTSLPLRQHSLPFSIISGCAIIGSIILFISSDGEKMSGTAALFAILMFSANIVIINYFIEVLLRCHLYHDSVVFPKQWIKPSGSNPVLKLSDIERVTNISGRYSFFSKEGNEYTIIPRKSDELIKKMQIILGDRWVEINH